MQLTLKQQQALELILKKYDDGDPYVVIRGYAGTGKTTLIKHFVEALKQEYGLIDADIVYTSFTGKAVQVMIDKGNKNAKTLHKLLFKNVPMPDGTFLRKPIDLLPYSVVICDEVSMASKELVDLLLTHPVFVVFCGDPGQLPPIDKNDDNHLLDKPDIFFDEIMRQAQDSGIIQLSMKVRNGDPITAFDSHDALVLPKTALTDDMLLWADIILCAKNETRNALNDRVRRLLGKKGLIAEDEKIICLRNYWDSSSIHENALTNGCIGYLKGIKPSFKPVFKYIGVPGNKIPTIQGTFVTETGDNFGIIHIDKQMITDNTSFLNDYQKYKMVRNRELKSSIPKEFAYGYAITTHKSQGSSWPKVLVIEENFPFGADEHRRWLYTAITRREKQVVVIQK